MDDVNHYRAISVLSVRILSKIIERHVHVNLFDYVNVHKLIHGKQFAGSLSHHIL